MRIDSANEAIVLSAAISSDRFYNLAHSSGVSADSFQTSTYGLIWTALGDCGWDKKINVPDLFRRLEAKNVTGANNTVRGLLADSPAWGSEVVASSIRELVGAKHSKAMEAILEELRNLSVGDGQDLIGKVSTIQSRLALLGSELGQGAGQGTGTTAHEEACSIIDELAINPAGSTFGIPSRFEGFNEMAGGYFPGKYYVIAARTSVGKTSWVCWEMLKLAEFGRVVYFTLEMDAKELSSKLLSMLTGIEPKAIRDRKLTLSDRNKLNVAANHPSFKRIEIVDVTACKPSYIRAKLASISGRLETQGQGEKIGSVIVDHLLLLQAENAKATYREQVMNNSHAMKSLAKEWKVPFLVLQQLSRDLEKNGEYRRPTLADLKETSAIEEDADLVMLMHGQRHQDELELILAKVRGGSLGSINVLFNRQAQTFTEIKPRTFASANEALRQLEAMEPVMTTAIHRDGADQLVFFNLFQIEGGKKMLIGQHVEGRLEKQRLAVTLLRPVGQADWDKHFYCYCDTFQHDASRRPCVHIKKAQDLKKAADEANLLRPVPRVERPNGDLADAHGPTAVGVVSGGSA